jgi:hypothetical protein
VRVVSIGRRAFHWFVLLEVSFGSAYDSSLPGHLRGQVVEGINLPLLAIPFLEPNLPPEGKLRFGTGIIAQIIASAFSLLC